MLSRLCYIFDSYEYHGYFCTSFFFFKQKTAYEMRISDWSSDVCSSDLAARRAENGRGRDAQDSERSRSRRRGPRLARGSGAGHRLALSRKQIGRASCRERVCPYV